MADDKKPLISWDDYPENSLTDRFPFGEADSRIDARNSVSGADGMRMFPFVLFSSREMTEEEMNIPENKAMAGLLKDPAVSSGFSHEDFKRLVERTLGKGWKQGGMIDEGKVVMREERLHNGEIMDGVLSLNVREDCEDSVIGLIQRLDENFSLKPYDDNASRDADLEVRKYVHAGMAKDFTKHEPYH